MLSWKSGGIATGSNGAAIPTAEDLMRADLNRGGPWSFYFHECTVLENSGGTTAGEQLKMNGKRRCLKKIQSAGASMGICPTPWRSLRRPNPGTPCASAGWHTSGSACRRPARSVARKSRQPARALSPRQLRLPLRRLLPRKPPPQWKLPPPGSHRRGGRRESRRRCA